MLNPELEKGDKIILLNMPDEAGMLPGTKGVVKGKTTVFGMVQYQVEWENGRKLDLLSDQDTWMKEKPLKKPKIEESKEDVLSKNKDLFENFRTTFLFNYLKVLRDSGIVNMFGASPYLYMGKNRIYHANYDNPIAEDNEKYDELLKMADQAQSEMVNGVIKVLEKEEKEISEENINRYLRKYSNKMWDLYVYRMR